MKFKNILKVSFITMLVSASVASAELTPSLMANERYTLNYSGRELSGRSSTIFLKQELRRMYPDLMLRDSELVGVSILAKSRMGNGRVDFISNGQVIESARISGRSESYGSSAIGTFDRVQFRRLPNRLDDDTWQLRFTGDIKLRSVVVVLDEAGDNDEPRFNNFSFSLLGSGKAGKIVSDTESFRVVNRMAADVVLIRVTDGNMTINHVDVRYANGTTERLSQLEDSLREGEQTLAYVGRNSRRDGRLADRIELITVRARSSNVLGSRADYEVYVGVRR